MKDYEIVKIEVTGSTNTELKDLAKNYQLKSGYVLISQRQSQGHGQFGRNFESPKGGLYLSLYIKKELPFDCSNLTKKIGLLVQSSIEEICKLKTTIKEPNDILYEGKKICGILVESFTSPGLLNIIIGIGLNLNTDIASFSDEIKDNANSISNILNKKTDPDLMTESILNKLKEI